MDLINDFICHCPLGKHQELGTCLQKYHAINFLNTVPWEYLKRLFLIQIRGNLFVYFELFLFCAFKEQRQELCLFILLKV